MHRLVTELIKTIVSNAFKSNHPHLLGRPVVAPNSCPIFASCSALESNNSVAKGPSPTRVVYALVIPKIESIYRGPTPKPEDKPPAVVLEEVTYG